MFQDKLQWLVFGRRNNSPLPEKKKKNLYTKTAEKRNMNQLHNRISLEFNNDDDDDDDNNNNNNNNNSFLQLSCHPVAAVILHVYKT